MNPLTMAKQIQNINAKELDLGISDEASLHAKYKYSAYVYVGELPYDLTEADLLEGTGRSKGFAFVAYEDQKSTNLAVDNLNGAKVLGRIIKVEHRGECLKREEEDDETKEKKREAPGVC